MEEGFWQLIHKIQLLLFSQNLFATINKIAKSIVHAPLRQPNVISVCQRNDMDQYRIQISDFFTGFLHTVTFHVSITRSVRI
jgi:hypothetical protein